MATKAKSDVAIEIANHISKPNNKSLSHDVCCQTEEFGYMLHQTTTVTKLYSRNHIIYVLQLALLFEREVKKKMKKKKNNFTKKVIPLKKRKNSNKKDNSE